MVWSRKHFMLGIAPMAIGAVAGAFSLQAKTSRGTLK